MKSRHISVCICTFKRPAMLQRLLDTMERQQTGGAFTFGIVVADNDAARSAEAVATAFSQRSQIPIFYGHESRQNIALARNKTIEHADGEFIAFIDDDEFPDDVWLATLLKFLEDKKVSGVLGPVRPHFDEPPPEWIIKGRFCERPEPPTGTVMHWEKCRTGNVLFRRSILRNGELPFEPQFGTGGEDKDFFMRMTQRGETFLWCNEGFVYETVPRDRWTRRYMLKRAMLRGRIVLKQPTGKLKMVATSCVALPIYTVILPFSYLAGEHVFMNFCIRSCDHLGRVLTPLGLNPIHER